MSPGVDNFDNSPEMAAHNLSASSSSSGRGERSEPPKRLRYWLIDMINSGEIPGLQWENSPRTIFRIPWKHAGKNNWKEEDCKIFQAWAEHRGKYKKGDKVEAATWKTRLRCALNKLPDIKELKERSYLDGKDPYRVYQLLPEPDKAQESEIYPRNSWGKESPSSQYITSPSQFNPSPGQFNPSPGQFNPTSSQFNASPRQYNSPPGVYDGNGYGLPQIQRAQLGMRASSEIPSPPQRPMPGLNHPLISTPPTVPTSEFKKLKVDERKMSTAKQENGYIVNKLEIVPPDSHFEPSTPMQHSVTKRNLSGETYEAVSPGSSSQSNTLLTYQGFVSSPGNSPINHGQLMNIDTYNCNSPVGPRPEPPLEIPFPMFPPQPYEMEIYIRYRGQLVKAIHVTNQTGCRVHFGDANLQLIAMAAHELPSAVFGPESLHQITLEDCESYAYSEKQIALTRHVLSNIKRGLVIQYEDGCFYARRLCKSRVFITGPESSSSTPDRLERNEMVKIFDNKKFLDSLRRYIAEERLKAPEIEINASFGQNWSIKTPLEKNLVTLTMVPRAARYLRYKVREQHNRFESLNDSIMSSCGPDSFDRIAELATMQSVKGFNDFIEQMVHGDPNFLSSVRPMTEQQPASSRETNTHTHTTQSGYFQPNNFTPAGIVPPAGVNDVEMVGYYPESHSRSTGMN